ncbi:Site-specific recombinase XerD [Hathewaya proteolytica DSM 3090]|uniref:Site-specific recombinase XerD n=1 Tax=Hathewaya proteolytica DSM 3090 TaxID=1121331 RepID=A0A1M6S4J0_9CLOT|nr:site-specific integrase [Hathewaya proteolytica]SHK39601.1 Site-specific recombinase XerD [Hathewaya proteolytica DSM 3090]
MAIKTNYEKNGSKYFRVTASIGRDSSGKLIRKEFYGKSKKEAEQKRDEYLEDVRAGANNRSTIQLGTFLYTWLFEVVKLSVKPSTFERYEGIYRNYIKDTALYTLILKDVSTMQIQKHYNKLFSDGCTSSMIYNLNKLLKKFFNYCVLQGYIVRNPCDAKKIIIPEDTTKNKTREIEVFTDEELERLKNEIKGDRLEALYLLALGTGMREGELLGLKWQDINYDEQTIDIKRSVKNVANIDSNGNKRYQIVVQAPKTRGSARTIPMPSKLITSLKNHKRMQLQEKFRAGSSYNDNDFIFTTELGTNIDASNLLKKFKKILLKANIPYRKFHALRHTFATKLFENDVPIKTVQELLGHSNMSITANIYTHVMPKKKTTAVETLNKYFI